MLGFGFMWPGALPFLLTVPLFWFVLQARERRLAQSRTTLLGPRVASLSEDLDPKRRLQGNLLLSLALLFTILALSQPLWGTERRNRQQRGVDILVCLDVSRSMLARDLAPNRLAFAKQEIQTLARHARGERLGLVTFAGDARLRVPLTRDVVSFSALVELADPLTVKRGGTDLGLALLAGSKALDRKTSRAKTLILITDGEDHGQQGLQAARRLAEQGLTLHCVGIGSQLGSKIRVRDRGRETFLRGPSGEEVLSYMDAQGLRAMAQATGGIFVDASQVQNPLIHIYEKAIRNMTSRVTEGDAQLARKNQFQWPLLLAFCFLFLELIRNDRRRR